MNYLKDKNLKFKRINIIENATIFFKDGDKKIYDAIYETDKGIFTGFTLNYKLKKNHLAKLFNNRGDESSPHYYLVFIDNGFVPENNIQSIKGGRKKLAHKRIFINDFNTKK